jgi:tetratricopeptide (TPR) repeat protein
MRLEAGGAYRVVDWYQLSHGQLISVTFGAASRLMIDPNPTVLQTLFGISSVDKDVLKQITVIGDLERAGKYKEAITALDQMPKAISESRLFMSKRVSLANMASDDELYRQALAKMAVLFGNDPAASFLLLDHYFYEGDLGKALQCISLMDSRVGVDGVTEQLRATLYFSKTKYDEGFSHARESIRLEPNRPEVYWLLALNYIHAGQFKNAIAIYQMIEQRFSRRFGPANFKGHDGMEAFVASAEFRKWMRGKQ